MLILALACAHAPPPEPAASAPAVPQAEARAFYLRAEAAAARGDLAEARRAAAWIPRLDRSDPWAWVHAGDLQLRAGYADGAVSSAREALARDPELPDAHRVAGLALLLGGEPEAALPHLDRAAGLAGVAAARVRALRLTGRADEAVVAFAAWTPTDPRGRLDRAAIALDLDLAEAALEQALGLLDDDAVGPEAARLALDAGRRLCRNTELHAALAARPGIVGDPRWSSTLLLVADALGDRELGARVARLDADPEVYARVLLETDPGAALTWLGSTPAPVVRGRALAALGRLDDAVEVWSQLPPDEALLLRADALLAAGRAEEALAATARVDGSSAAWVRAGALAVLGRPDDAVRVAVESARDPLDAALRELRVRALVGDVAGVLASAGAALALDRCQPDALARRAAAEPPCDAAESWARAAAVRPADPALSQAWAAARARCEDAP